MYGAGAGGGGKGGGLRGMDGVAGQGRGGRKETLGFTSTETIKAYKGRGSWGVGKFYI